MPAILGVIMKVLAGVGIGELADKIFPGKIDKPFSGDTDRMPKLLKWAAVVAVGAVAFTYISRKLKLKF
jgi:hypothetical protein